MYFTFTVYTIIDVIIMIITRGLVSNQQRIFKTRMIDRDKDRYSYVDVLTVADRAQDRSRSDVSKCIPSRSSLMTLTCSSRSFLRACSHEDPSSDPLSVDPSSECSRSACSVSSRLARASRSTRLPWFTAASHDTLFLFPPASGLYSNGCTTD